MEFALVQQGDLIVSSDDFEFVDLKETSTVLEFPFAEGCRLHLQIAPADDVGDALADKFCLKCAEDLKDCIIGFFGEMDNWSASAVRLKEIIQRFLFTWREGMAGNTAQVILSSYRISDDLALFNVFVPNFLSNIQHVEDCMDLVEQTMETANDTLDEADLCLPVGVILFVDGCAVHSSLCHEDMREIFNMFHCLGVWDRVLQNPYPGTMTFSVHACIERRSGMRIPNRCFTESQDKYALENRIVALVWSRSVLMVRVLISQHFEIDGSNHLDPFGLIPMRRALSELLELGLLDSIRQEIKSSFSDVVENFQNPEAIKKTLSFWGCTKNRAHVHPHANANANRNPTSTPQSSLEVYLLDVADVSLQEIAAEFGLEEI